MLAKTAILNFELHNPLAKVDKQSQTKFGGDTTKPPAWDLIHD